jgi:hypothetical protein
MLRGPDIPPERYRATRERFKEAVERADLEAMVRGDCGPPHGGKFPCPWHTSDNPNGSHTLTINAVDRRHWRCWSCDASGSAIDWLVRRNHLTPEEAVRIILGMPDAQAACPRPTLPSGPLEPARASPRPRPTSTPEAWRSPHWQRAVDELVRDAERALWSSSGAAARGWLRNRALADDTIRRFRLGYVARAHRRPVEGGRGILVERGVLIPWCGPEGWYPAVPDPDGVPDPPFRWCGANVRCLPDGDLTGPDPTQKYQAISGSSRGYLYPFPDLQPGVPALVCEGELDSLIGWQEAGWVVNAVSVGGAGQRPKPAALDALNDAGHWLVLPDADVAGARSLARWEALDAHRVVPVLLPGSVKDLTRFVQGGGDVLRWLAGEFRSMGWVLPRALRDLPT